MIQAPSLILPRVWVTGLETELILDLVEHTSIEFPVEFLQEKAVHILAVEAGPAGPPVGVPGNLQIWVELSPLPSANSAYWAAPLPTAIAYWAAIGGGGGAIIPTAPLVLVGTGAATMHTAMLNWNIHSGWARVVVQTPVAAALPMAFWAVQILFSGKSA